MADPTRERIWTIGQELKTGGAGPFTFPDSAQVDTAIPVLTGGDIRSYSTDNEIATNEGNAIDRPAPVPVTELKQYTLENQYKINASEPENFAIYARVALCVSVGDALIAASQSSRQQALAASQAQLERWAAEFGVTVSAPPTPAEIRQLEVAIQKWPDPSDIRPSFWPDTFRQAAGQGVTQAEWGEAKTFLTVVDDAIEAELDTDNTAFNQALNGIEALGCLSGAQKNEIKGRKSNRISRAREILTGTWTVGQVEEARKRVP